MAKKKESKTNALRIVEQQKIPYTLYHYTWSEDAVSANHVADQLLEKKEAQIFKTLLFVGNVTGPIVAVIPSNQEADLKKLFPEETWNKIHLQIIFFGRQYCPARGHNAHVCPICSVIGRRSMF